MKTVSLASRALRMAAIRIALVAAFAGVVSYKINRDQIERSARRQLLLSTSERLQREAAPFTEVSDIQRNFLREFMESYDDPQQRAKALSTFADLFVLDPDEAWREVPGLYDGRPTSGGLRFPKIGVVKAPETEPLTDDCKARMVLAVEWVYRYGNALRGRHLNFSATLPEHVLVMFAPVIPFDSRTVVFSGKNAFRLEDYESYTLSLNRDHDGFGVTPMYLDPTINTWMVTAYSWLARPPDGAKLASVSLDISLGELMRRSANPGIPGCSTVILRGDPEGKIVYHPARLEEIQRTQGTASARSTGDPELLQIQIAAKEVPSGTVRIIETSNQFVAVGRIPDADWILAIRHPKSLMQPAILQNLMVVAVVGLLALLVELFILREILQKQVGRPLAQLTEAIRRLGKDSDHLRADTLPIHAQDELGQLAREFSVMANRVEEAHDSLEANVALRTREAAAAQAEAEAANRAKSAFLANMSHEIRTPMNAILGFTELMSCDPSLSGEQLENVHTINRAGEHLLALINDALEMSKIEAGHITRHDSAFDLHGVLGDLLEIFSARAKGKGITVALEKSSSLPRYVVSDEGKIRQTLVNLVGNAVKFTTKGGVKIIATASPNTARGCTVSFTVVDTGPGLTAEEIDKLFRPFVQSAAGESMGGTGLGLTISRQYAQLLDGDISVTSEPGKGASFTFTATVKPVGEAEVMHKEALPSPRRLSAGQSVRILIVDDVATNRDLLEAILKPMGFLTKLVTNGAEAVETVGIWKPHAVLMDMRMPIMDGYEANHRIRAMVEGRSVFIIGLTASAFDEDRSEVLESGADVFMRKPFKRDELLTILRERLHLRFDYGETVPTKSQPAPASADFSGLPDPLCAEIRKACEAADYDRLLELCETLATGGDTTAATALRERVMWFDYAGILELLTVAQPMAASGHEG